MVEKTLKSIKTSLDNNGKIYLDSQSSLMFEFEQSSRCGLESELTV